MGKNRDISLGLAGDPGAILTAITEAASGRIDRGARQQRQEWMARLRAIEAAKLERLMPMFLNDSTPIHPYRLAWEINRFLGDDTIYIGDGGDIVTISAQASSGRANAGTVDGSGRAGFTRRGYRVFDGRQAGASRKRRWSACTATVRSA